ncbi:DNA alkylation repair protein [Ferruginibacter paludis]|uniref:DNA alkylation repair protein n=1 Tax=Ferruginibacter paludis TaxID=1310417 RepID=UPI0025B2FE34|nr:DNA alkylation repair protein [Ferruginibacter paludis]MDN3658431.1 DNA alkylation repair protein [Ferruginibacter paludis]
MTKDEVIKTLATLGSEQTKKTFTRHGAREPVFGVKVGDMKPIQKKIKKDYSLALDLFATGNADAQYFAGLIADESKMTKKDLAAWVKNANYSMINEYTVAWIAAESKHGWKLALEWIESSTEKIAASGWATFANIVAIQPDDLLDIKKLEELLKTVTKKIHTSANRVRHTMNQFVIATGSYVVPLGNKAKEAAKEIGLVTVNMGDTACKEPDAIKYINKAISMGKPGNKKKEARC